METMTDKEGSMIIRFSINEVSKLLFSILELFSDICKKVFGIAVDKANRDAVTTYVCVFNEFDQKQAARKFSISLDRVMIVGSPDILKFQGIRATEKIAESQNAKVIVIGAGEDGLPIILGGQ